MTLFWIVGATLAAGVAFIAMRPLLARRPSENISRRDANIAIYRDQLRELDADLRAGTLAQADYERARRELEARLLEDAAQDTPASATRSRRLGWAVGGAIPVVALAAYLATGNPGALLWQPDPHTITTQQLEDMVGKLAARMREQPDDVDGWKLLGRSYGALGRFPEAADAYAKAAVRSPRDAQLLADFADALAMARGQTLAGEPEKLIARALELDPKNLKALALSGTAAFARRDYAAAAATWERMLPLVPADSEDARVIRENVQEARSMVGKKDLKGSVSLSAKLKGEARPDDTVFIFARAAEGPQMPLAVKRVKVSELPAAFDLNDAMAMAPGMSLSAHPRVVVVARISRSGQPTAQPGDLQGSSGPVANDAQGVKVVIDSVVR
jgi:cytochrome c-type biogenesis protein CcmH